MQATVCPGVPNGTVSVPPSKSMAHRAIIMASLANGRSVIENIILSEDMRATIGAMKALGAGIMLMGSSLTIDGIGGGYRDEVATLDCAESGSTLRFLIPLCSATRKYTTFTGRGRLLDRPQSVYRQIFNECGVCFTHNADEITVAGGLKSGEFTVQGDVSSQFITGLLLVLPLLKGNSTVRIIPPFESRSYVELTLQTMAVFGVNASFSDDNTLQIPGGQQYHKVNYTVEGDYSQLAFFAVLGAINGTIEALNMRKNSLQGDRVIAKIISEFTNANATAIDGLLFKKAPLITHDIDLADCPDLGPILMVLASFAEGNTTIYNAGRLRIKESDRIASMESELTKLGVTITSTDDTITIAGRKAIGGQVTVQAHNDHRIAMSLAVFAACSNVTVTIEGAECVNKSYPDFFVDLAKVGIRVELTN